MRMALFKDFIKKKEEKSESKRAALDALETCVNVMAACTRKETIKLTKQPYEGKKKALNISVQYHASPMGGPVFAYYLIESIAKACGVNFESMMSMVHTVYELMPEITEGETIVRKETKESDGED